VAVGWAYRSAGTCTDARNRGSGHTQSKEISTFFYIRVNRGCVESLMKEKKPQVAGKTCFL
jgi:hypothetical protein